MTDSTFQNHAGLNADIYELDTHTNIGYKAYFSEGTVLIHLKGNLYIYIYI